MICLRTQGGVRFVRGCSVREEETEPGALVKAGCPHRPSPRPAGHGSFRRSPQARYLRQNRLHHMGFLDSRQLRVEALMLVSKAVVVDPEQV